MNMNSAFLLLALSEFDVVCLAVAVILLELLLRRQELAAQTATIASSIEPVAVISSSAAQQLVFDLVNDIRSIGVQLEIINKFQQGMILEIRHSAKASIEQSVLIELLRSVSGVSSVYVGGGKSKGYQRRTPVTVSVYFSDDAKGHHAYVNLVEAIA